MSQLDAAIYTPLFFWFFVGLLSFYSMVTICIVPSLYKVLRLRDIFIKNLGKGIFVKVGCIVALKKIFLLKFFSYRINDYYIYLSKKLKP